MFTAAKAPSHLTNLCDSCLLTVTSLSLSCKSLTSYTSANCPSPSLRWTSHRWPTFWFFENTGAIVRDVLRANKGQIKAEVVLFSWCKLPCWSNV